MEYAVVLVFVGATAVGVVAAVVRTWNLHSRLYSLEDRVNILEGVQQREVKIRAAEARWNKSRPEDAMIQAALDQKPEKKKPWTPWYKNPNLKVGGYNG